MKALILAGGRGRRLGNITQQINKCMIPIGGKPVIEYNLERAADIPNITEIIIVVGHRAEDIINRYGTQFGNKTIRYVIQWDQRGLVHAIECAKNALERDDFFLFLGDEILINSRHREMIQKFTEESPFALCGILNQEIAQKICRTYTLLTNVEGQVLRLIEKPKTPLNKIQGTGHCIFNNEILSYIERTPIHPERGERELPDLIQSTIDDGHTVKMFNICDYYTNINTDEDRKEIENLI